MSGVQYRAGDRVRRIGHETDSRASHQNGLVATLIEPQSSTNWKVQLDDGMTTLWATMYFELVDSPQETTTPKLKKDFDADLANDLAATLGGFGVHVIRPDGTIGGMGSMGWVASAALNSLWQRGRLVSVASEKGAEGEYVDTIRAYVAAMSTHGEHNKEMSAEQFRYELLEWIDAFLAPSQFIDNGPEPLKSGPHGIPVDDVQVDPNEPLTPQQYVDSETAHERFQAKAKNEEASRVVEICDACHHEHYDACRSCYETKGPCSPKEPEGEEPKSGNDFWVENTGIADELEAAALPEKTLREKRSNLIVSFACLILAPHEAQVTAERMEAAMAQVDVLLNELDGVDREHFDSKRDEIRFCLIAPACNHHSTDVLDCIAAILFGDNT